MDLNDYIRVYDGVLDENTCKNAIETCNAKSDQQYRWDNQHKPQYNVLNISYEADNGDREWDVIQSLIITGVQFSAQQYMKDLSCESYWPNKNSLEQIKLIKYLSSEGDRFDLHIDMGDVESSKRFLAIQFFLNDVEEGGEIFFPTINRTVTPKAGSVLLYPPNWMYPSQDYTPVSSNKYILTTYLHYQ